MKLKSKRQIREKGQIIYMQISPVGRDRPVQMSKAGRHSPDQYVQLQQQKSWKVRQGPTSKKHLRSADLGPGPPIYITLGLKKKRQNRSSIRILVNT